MKQIEFNSLLFIQIDAQVIKKTKNKNKNIIEQLRKKKKKFDRMQYLEDSSTFFIL